LGRMAALDAGYDTLASGVTLDRFCGSGITVANLGAATIMSGMEHVVIAGGSEMMSSYRENSPRTPMPFLDSGNEHLRAIHPQPHQGVSADVIATLEKIPRSALDELSLESQRRAAVAQAEGRFDKSLIAVHHPDGSLALDRDEYPRPQTTLESLAGLTPAFTTLADHPLDDQGTTFRSLVHQKFPGLDIEHVHHAGNSSGVVDGAAAILMTSDAYAKANGLTPRARIRAFANVGDDPTLMLNAPVPAARKVLDKAGLTLDDIDLFEVNEAFAVVAEKFIRDLDIDRNKINVNGGAIALGHPIGATGAMLIGTVLDELERTDGTFGLVTMCAAGGMAPAVIIERI
ncbi:MAG TPA: acetyl-CoA C-acetyltransferase, partial [Microthrixaceae bacterium]|nr:acetyl-CoA C-acetyltransferase [Microthrixaceae bacterium]